MKKFILTLLITFTFNASARYTIMSAVQLNEGQEDQYLALEAFFGPIHDLAIEKGIQEWQAVWKVTSEIGENGPHYIINTGFSSKEQLDAYNNSWTTDDWVALAKEAHKGKISNRRIERIMSSVGSESKERRNYHLKQVDRTIWAGGSLEPGDNFVITPTQAQNDDFEKYELVMRQMRKVLIRMDEVLLECTNITPEECSDWNKVFESLKESANEIENRSAFY